MRIKWTEPAGRVLESIQDYIARDNPSAAFDAAQKIRHAAEQLRDHPRLGRAWRVRGTYELVIPDLPFITAYRIKGKEVQILNVYHTSRKWPEVFE